jgi:hypothetical protein
VGHGAQTRPIRLEARAEPRLLVHRSVHSGHMCHGNETRQNHQM